TKRHAAIAAQEGSQRCERFLRAPLEKDVLGFVPRQRHWMESPITRVPLTRHQTMTSVDQGCSQKTLAPLATILLPLARQHARPRRTGESVNHSDPCERV